MLMIYDPSAFYLILGVEDKNLLPLDLSSKQKRTRSVSVYLADYLLHQ